MKLLAGLKSLLVLVTATACLADITLVEQANAQLAIGRYSDAANLFTKAIGELTALSSIEYLRVYCRC